MSEFVSLVLVDRESEECNEEWGRGFKSVLHVEFDTLQEARQFFSEQDYIYSSEDVSGFPSRFVLIPYMGKR